MEIKTASIDCALTIPRRKKQASCLRTGTRRSSQESPFIGRYGATLGDVGDVRGQDGDRRRGKRSLPRLPSNEACQPDDERQGRKPDG